MKPYPLPSVEADSYIIKRDVLDALYAELEELRGKTAQDRQHINFDTRLILKPGEHYAGIILDEQGQPSHHLILIQGEQENVTWPRAQEWARNLGAELPTRREQALLYANLKDQFKPEWYWSSEQQASGSDYAWVQYFYDGSQRNYLTLSKLRARAVRRIEVTK